MDHRLGPHPRVRPRRRDRGRRVVGLRRHLSRRSRSSVSAAAECGARNGSGAGRRTRGHGHPEPTGRVHRRPRHRPARHRHSGIRARQRRHRRDQGRRRAAHHRRRGHVRLGRLLAAVHPGKHRHVWLVWLERRAARSGRHLLRLHRLRCRLDGGAGNPEPSARLTDRHLRLARSSAPFSTCSSPA